MKLAINVIHWLVRLCGVIMLALGLLFWTNNALNLLPVHMFTGFFLVLLLWTLAILAARAGVGWGRVALALAWGLIMPALGMTQTRLLPGSFHIVIEALHLLVGVAAVGMGENLARRIKQAGQPVATAEPAVAGASTIGR
jgi:hypothetical protein